MITYDYKSVIASLKKGFDIHGNYNMVKNVFPDDCI